MNVTIERYLPIMYPKLFIGLTAMMFLACSTPKQNNDKESTAVVLETAEQPKRPTVGLPRFPSPAATVSQTIGRSSVTIQYSRPSVTSPEGVDRTGRIWGHLVPYDFNFRPSMGGGKPRPWRAGANENTIIEFSDDTKVEGQPIKAGKYGLHMVIHESGGATVIFSNKSDAWGSFAYDEADDALRVEARTEEVPLTDRLIYTIPVVNKTSGEVYLDWEYKRIAFSVEFETHGMVISDLRKYLQDTTGLTWRDYNRAASYCGDNKVNMEEGLSWTDTSIRMEKNYTNLSTKSTILQGLGQIDEAQKLRNEALNLPSTTANNLYSYGSKLIRTGKISEAERIFEMLEQRYPDDWLTAHGYGRLYSAKGNFDKAIEFEMQALTKAPQANKGFIQRALEMLKKGEDFN